jgi:hypothetical protein
MYVRVRRCTYSLNGRRASFLAEVAQAIDGQDDLVVLYRRGGSRIRYAYLDAMVMPANWPSLFCGRRVFESCVRLSRDRGAIRVSWSLYLDVESLVVAMILLVGLLVIPVQLIRCSIWLSEPLVDRAVSLAFLGLFAAACVILLRRLARCVHRELSAMRRPFAATIGKFA